MICLLYTSLLAEEERAELELSVADARAKMAEIDALLADNDWRAYIQSRKDELAALTPDELGNQSPEEVEVQIEILEMCIRDKSKGFGFSSAASWLYFLFVLAALLLAFLVFGRKEKDPMRQKDKERRRAARRAEKRHRQAQRAVSYTHLHLEHREPKGAGEKHRL